MGRLYLMRLRDWYIISFNTSLTQRERSYYSSTKIVRNNREQMDLLFSLANILTLNKMIIHWLK